MSKTFRVVLFIFVSFLQILQFFTNCRSQDLEATITVDADQPHAVTVEGRYHRGVSDANSRGLSFLDTYAGVEGLAKRFSLVKTSDVKGHPVAAQKLSDAEYRFEPAGSSWSYLADLTPIPRTTAGSHLSWLGPAGGYLIVDDLLPQGRGKTAVIKLNVPANWVIYTTAPATADGRFEIANIEETGFAIGPIWHQKAFKVGATSVNVLATEGWAFSEDDMAAMIREILGGYTKMLRSPPPPKVQIAAYKFPFQTNFGEWEADTRGASVTIAASDMPFKSQAAQSLHQQLRHEIFHLWVPNRLNLTGNYDWFYEGFALYQSLKLGVSLGRIRFEDMLSTFARGYNIDATETRRRSLIEHSRERWNGGNTAVYARGLLVAFLCDLALLETSQGKLSSDDLLRQIYARYSGSAPADGNVSLLKVMDEHAELAGIVQGYIIGTEPVKWDVLLAAAGLESRTAGREVTLEVTAKPSGRQRELLNKLGYNSWRNSPGNK